MRPRLLILAAAILALLPLLPAAAGPVGICAFDAGTGVVTVTPIGDTNIWRDGDAILANEDTCGGATVTTVDAIEVAGTSAEWVQVWLATGAFAPGKTSEGDGSSEIEFTFSGVALGKVTISGTDGPDHLAAGMTVGGDDPSINLNAAEATPDVDVTFTAFPGILDVALGDGDDRWSEAGIGDEALPLWVGSHVIVGGPGDDLMAPANSDSPEPIFDGGGGVDTLSFGSAPEGCDVTAYGGNGLLTGSLTSCGGAFTFGRFERFEGHAGVDWLGGDGGDDVVLTRGGADLIFADNGNDTLNGGRGRDGGIWIQTGRVRVDLRDGTALLGAKWIQTVLGIEDLVGSGLNDVLIGNGKDNAIQGEGGDDVLLGKGGIDDLDGGAGSDTCISGSPGHGETVTRCEG